MDTSPAMPGVSGANGVHGVTSAPGAVEMMGFGGPRAPGPVMGTPVAHQPYGGAPMSQFGYGQGSQGGQERVALLETRPS